MTHYTFIWVIKIHTNKVITGKPKCQVKKQIIELNEKKWAILNAFLAKDISPWQKQNTTKKALIIEGRTITWTKFWKIN